MPSIVSEKPGTESLSLFRLEGPIQQKGLLSLSVSQISKAARTVVRTWGSSSPVTPQ